MATERQRCRESVLALTRLCVRDKARLRPERWATADDCLEFFADLRRPVGDLRRAVEAVFAGPEWEFTGLWTATRHKVSRMPKLTKMYRLRTPEERRVSA